MKPKVYISSSLRPEVYARVTVLLERYGRDYEILRPSLVQPDHWTTHVIDDVRMIREADEIWLMGEYGRDCSWEMGFATALGKKVRIFRDASNSTNLDNDWMLWYPYFDSDTTRFERGAA